MLHTSPSPERLRALRARALLTQREVQGVTGIAQPTLSRLECGRCRPQTYTLRRLLGLYTQRINANERQERVWAATAGA